MGKRTLGGSGLRTLPNRDEELRPAFLGRMRNQLLSDFANLGNWRRRSDSTVGSGPEFANPAGDKIEELQRQIDLIKLKC
jgi:hypothetical protein